MKILFEHVVEARIKELQKKKHHYVWIEDLKGYKHHKAEEGCRLGKDEAYYNTCGACERIEELKKLLFLREAP